MGFFTDQMRGFTEHLHDSICQRKDALESIHHATEHVLDEAREFVGEVTEHHHAMAADLKSRLAAHRKTHKGRVAAMRQQHRHCLRQMSDHLRQSLGAHQRELHENVHGMKRKFAEAQSAVAEDLRGAASAWRESAAKR